jgi:two-component system nitrate/nitrite response regulator NarL
VPSLERVEETGFAEASCGVSRTGTQCRPRLALVDPSRLRRDCLGLAVQGEGWHVADMPAVPDLLRRLSRGETFDAVLIGGASGAGIAVEEVARLAAAAPLAPILVAADCENARRVVRLRSAGAYGVLPADTGLAMLRAALAHIRADPAVPSDRPPPGTVRSTGPSRQRLLTRRQREVLALLSEGKSNRLIAAALALSEDTVKVHVKEIIKRLNVANRTQAALVATGAARTLGPAFPRPPERAL